MAVYECQMCDERWPHEGRFITCPRCGKRCRPDFAPHPPIDLRDAERRRCHAAFDRLYERREHERERQGLPSPEQLGRLDARKLIREAAELEANVAR